MNELHLFAGAGGGILGGILLGHTCVCAVEIEPYCRQVLLQRQRDGLLPQFPIWDDVRTFDGRPWRGLVDVVCGGFPCQDISAAGKGKGITGERSGLWSEMVRIIGEVRPRFTFVENSPMLTVRGLGVVLGGLAEMGYDAKWCVLGAINTGLLHRRERIWIYANDSENTNPRNDRSGGCRTNPSVTNRIRPKNIEEWRTRLGELATLDVISRVSSYAEGRRAFYGLARGMDRLAAIGNGQVPAVAALAWRILSQSELAQGRLDLTERR